MTDSKKVSADVKDLEDQTDGESIIAAGVTLEWKDITYTVEKKVEKVTVTRYLLSNMSGKHLEIC